MRKMCEQLHVCESSPPSMLLLLLLLARRAEPFGIDSSSLISYNSILRQTDTQVHANAHAHLRRLPRNIVDS